ncbi:hypothetical protein MKW92_026918 [Papaver armeniacum]|nr:hypothetical protein MKW92_026918 [Papaver armeniacum]
MATPTKIIAEYAKSNRSSCKKCSNSISANSLRLGLHSKDPRGYDVTKWHHLNCFPRFASTYYSWFCCEYSSLFVCFVQIGDQEALEKLTAGCDLESKQVLKEDEAAIDEPQNKSKTSKPSAKIVTEYAKSGRSSCKKCSEAIPAKSLRLGSISKEQGHDVTRWYHPSCFPIDSQPIISVNKVDGFSSLKIVDQEALQKVMDGCDQLPKEVVVEGSDGQSSREFKVRKTDETILDEGKDSSSKKLKVAELEIAFSTSDVQKRYKDSTLSPNWKAFQTLIFLERDEGLRDSGKIAAFDFDGCLANTNVKRIGADAWSLMFQSIPEKLNNLYKDGYKLVIFTNESNIERWKNKRQVAIDSKIGRLKNFIDRVKVPIQVFIACGFDNAGKGKDLFRKPNTGMWRLMEQQFNSGIPIDMDQSFYVGDAAGRKNDHSDADIKFAEAIGLKFYLPEDFFAA